MVREAGVEPARPCEHRHLKPASLPIPPLAQAVDVLLLRTGCIIPRGKGAVNSFFEKNEKSCDGAKLPGYKKNGYKGEFLRGFALTGKRNGAMMNGK